MQNVVYKILLSENEAKKDNSNKCYIKLTAASKAVFSLNAPTHPVKPMMKVMAPEKMYKPLKTILNRGSMNPLGFRGEGLGGPQWPKKCWSHL